MITRLDHFVLICPDIEAGVGAYETLLGAPPAWRAEDAQMGSATALFKVDNTAIELMAPTGEGLVGARLSEMLDDTGPALTSLAYEVPNIDMAHHAFGRRGLVPSEIGDGESTDIASGETRTWKRFRCADVACAGVKSFVLQYTEDRLPAREVAAGGVTSLCLLYTSPSPRDRG